MAYRFEHDAPRVQPEGREVRLRVLRKDLRFVDHVAARRRRKFGDDGVDVVHCRAGPHHERQVLQAGLMPRVVGLLGRWIKEQVSTRLARRRAVRELVVGVDVYLEFDERHDRAVIAPRSSQVWNIDADVSEHSATLTAGRS